MKSRNVLITGASGGIGYELARIFATRGYNLIIVARSADKLHALASELLHTGADVKVITTDLSLPNAAQTLHNQLKQQGLHVDILINNAGFGLYGDFSETPWERELQMLNLNIVALTELTKLYVNDMKKQQFGKILNVASVAAFMPGPYMAVYFASKAYVLSFSEALAAELKGTGVTVTALCPGPTRTGFETTANASDSGLFEKMPQASALEVAEYAYKSLMKGKQVAVYGILNKLNVLMVRLLPKKLFLLSIIWLMKPKKKD